MLLKLLWMKSVVVFPLLSCGSQLSLIRLYRLPQQGSLPEEPPPLSPGKGWGREGSTFSSFLNVFSAQFARLTSASSYRQKPGVKCCPAPCSTAVPAMQAGAFAHKETNPLQPQPLSTRCNHAASGPRHIRKWFRQPI